MWKHDWLKAAKQAAIPWSSNLSYDIRAFNLVRHNACRECGGYETLRLTSKRFAPTEKLFQNRC
jgi:hypothetical protein